MFINNIFYFLLFFIDHENTKKGMKKMLTDLEKAQAVKLAEISKMLGPEQMRLWLTFGEGFVAAMDHFGIHSANDRQENTSAHGTQSASGVRPTA